MDKIKLKWRIFLYLLGFCGLLLVTLWLFQTVLLNDMYKAIRKSEIEKSIIYVEENISDTNMRQIIRDLSNDQNILVTPADEFRLPEEENLGEPKRAATITQTKEFTLDNGKKISLTFHAVITPVNATIHTLRLQLYIITAIMIFLSIILSIIISKRISKPIEQINSSAKSLASGNYNTSFKGKGFLEITELSSTLNTAAQELSKVENLRRELMANISHDLRTPLALIYSYAEMMHDFPSEINNDQMQIIMDETTRMSSLVNDILDISKLENGTMQLHLTKYNLTQSLQKTISNISELTKNKHYTFSFEYDCDICVIADQAKITQVFYNLLINAINYSRENKDICIRQQIDKGFVKIEVNDQGDGIEPSQMPYIWDRYYTNDGQHERAITGTGLGLSIVKQIITLHDGHYGVESEIHKGSTFWFSLKTPTA